MKQRSKERFAALLLDELLEELASRDSIKKKLEEMTSYPMDELIKLFVQDIERLIESYRVDEAQRPSSLQKSELAVPQAASGNSRLRPPSLASDNPAEKIKSPAPSKPDGGKEVRNPELEKEKKPDKEFLLRPGSETTQNASGLVESRKSDILYRSALETPQRQSSVTSPLPTSANSVGSAEGGLAVEKLQSLRKEFEHLEQKIGEEIATALAHESEKKRKEIKAAIEHSHPFTSEDQNVIEEFGGAEHEQPSGLVPEVGIEVLTEDFPDECAVYLYAVCRSTETHAIPELLVRREEKGIDGRVHVCAFDYDGIRCYLSKINTNLMNLSKRGLLLLTKQESLHLQAVHQMILNQLREQEVIVPCAFGTLALGKKDLRSKIDRYSEELESAVKAESIAQRWTLELFVLDSRVAQLVGTGPTNTVRAWDRLGQAHPTPVRKFDIKYLEKILNREKELAEHVHHELAKRAAQSAVEMIVNLGSGSSEDWKLILKSVYEVVPDAREMFFRTITDLQHQHIASGPMLVVTGKAPSFGF